MTRFYTMIQRPSFFIFLALSLLLPGIGGVFAQQIEDAFFDEEPAEMMAEEEDLYLAQAETRPTPGGAVDLQGFADTAWKANFSQVKQRLKNLATSVNVSERVEILNEVRNKFILVRRNGVLYRYSFYRTPYNVALLNNHDLSVEEHDQEEAVLFHVKVSTPFIDSKLVKDKLTGLYGLNTKTTVDKKMMGADIWELDGGLIFQWYEPLRGRAFTRTVDYLSLDVAEVILAEYADYFDAREKLILQKILLQ